jgi:predicted HTH transcriptional regulator
LSRLATEKFILPKGGEFYDITNMGAILFAKDLHTFDSLQRKAVRVIVYKGAGWAQGIRGGFRGLG